jgi:CheY-like chemotaxis protein
MAQGRVLVVDDNDEAADLLSMLLQTEGHDTEVAYDGPSALAKAAEFQPHVICSDIGMPGMSGLEVARRIRQGETSARVLLIATTGWNDIDMSKEIVKAGFDIHMTKPISYADLAAHVRHFFQRRPPSP